MESTSSEETEKSLDQEIYKRVSNEVERRLDSALYSRIGHDGIVVFHPISPDGYRRIVLNQIQQIRDYFADDLEIFTDDKFLELVLYEADTREEGARQIKRLLTKYMREPLVRRAASGNLRQGDKLLFTAEDGKVIVRRAKRPGFRPMPEFKIPDTSTDLEKLKETIEQELNEGLKKLLRQRAAEKEAKQNQSQNPRHMAEIDVYEDEEYDDYEDDYNY